MDQLTDVTPTLTLYQVVSQIAKYPEYTDLDENSPNFEYIINENESLETRHTNGMKQHT